MNTGGIIDKAFKGCASLMAGDDFPAEINGQPGNQWMTLVAAKGGNQGKPVKLKYKIVDIG